jgi:hypothetical protein
MKIKVKATHYVEASSWREAEYKVEQGDSTPVEIESEPSSKSPLDLLYFAIAAKLEDEHRKIFFESDGAEYETKMQELREKMDIWLKNGMEHIISANEFLWS